MKHGLQESTWNFIRRYIDSVEQLEILLLFQRHPNEEWGIQRISQEIRTSASSTQNRVSSLLASGLISEVKTHSEPLYRYAPSSDELDQSIVELEREYKIRRVRVIDAIYARPAEKMMNFLDAFKIRKSDKDE